MDYKNGKIYRLICEETNKQYIGSTCTELRKRLHNHKRTKNNNCRTKYFINPSIILIEDYPCERKEQLLMRERYFIETMECVNKNRPILSEEERTEKMREISKKHYQDNLKKNKEKNKTYYEKHKEELNRKARERYAAVKLNKK